MATIIPAIIPQSRQDLEEHLARLVGVAEQVQIDIIDGVFAEPASWPYLKKETESLPLSEQFHFEMDLMVRDPERVAGKWIDAGATRILVHLESVVDLSGLLTTLERDYGHEKGFASHFLSVGIAINVSTDLALLAPYLDRIDYVQFMGIKNIGKQGQPFSTEVLNKIAVFRRAHPDMPIQVDGGVNMESAPLLIAAGVSRLIVGSALWGTPDVKRRYAELSALDQMHGLYE